jgi:hypothetical protein
MMISFSIPLWVIVAVYSVSVAVNLFMFINDALIKGQISLVDLFVSMLFVFIPFLNTVVTVFVIYITTDDLFGRDPILWRRE